MRGGDGANLGPAARVGFRRGPVGGLQAPAIRLSRRSYVALQWRGKTALSYSGLLAVAGLMSCGSDSDEPYKIGAMDALTGVAESYGNPLHRAKLLAVEEINAAGGIDGRMLELIVEDSKCAAQDAITAYNKLTDVDGVKIILGATCSGAMLGAAPRAEADGVIPPLGVRHQPRHRHRGRLHLPHRHQRPDSLASTSATRCGPTVCAASPPSPSRRTTPRAPAAPPCAIRGAGRHGRGGGELLVRGARLPQPAHQAVRAGPGRAAPGLPGRGLRRHHHQAGPRAGLRRPHLLGSRSHGA